MKVKSGVVAGMMLTDSDYFNMPDEHKEDCPSCNPDDYDYRGFKAALDLCYRVACPCPCHRGSEE